jgi:hypothetical protein
MNCRLCNGTDLVTVCEQEARKFVKCLTCRLVFVPEQYFLLEDEEKKRYELHDNTPSDSGYVEYIRGFAAEIDRIPVVNPHVLDFGSGPAMMLARELETRHIKCDSHDPLYGIVCEGYPERYDVIAACEVMEHVKNIRKEMDFFRTLLKRPGYLAVRTELYNESTDFKLWWYARDKTHVNFFCPVTMLKIAELLGKAIIYTNGKNVIIFG